MVKPGSNLQDVSYCGNATVEIIRFEGLETAFSVPYGKVGFGTETPSALVTISDIAKFDDQNKSDNVFSVFGNVTASYYHGDGRYLSNISTNLHQISENGNVTSNILQFINAETAFVTLSNVGIANLAPIHTLDVGSNLYVLDESTNVVSIRGNISAFYFYGDGSFLSNVGGIDNVHNLHTATTTGNVTLNSLRFMHPEKSFITLSNVGIANLSPVHTLDIGSNFLSRSHFS